MKINSSVGHEKHEALLISWTLINSEKCSYCCKFLCVSVVMLLSCGGFNDTHTHVLTALSPDHPREPVPER